MKIVLCMILFAFVFLVIWYVHYTIQTKRLLNVHQKEWNKIKNEMVIANKSEHEIEKRYIQYTVSLEETPYGRCFPHI